MFVFQGSSARQEEEGSGIKDRDPCPYFLFGKISNFYVDLVA
jgi:hypothetical protein